MFISYSSHLEIAHSYFFNLLFLNSLFSSIEALGIKDSILPISKRSGLSLNCKSIFSVNNPPLSSTQRNKPDRDGIAITFFLIVVLFFG
jgi:hypothetical protein